MKIIPANQSLILAGESPFLGQGSRLVAGGPAVPRVTVAASTEVVVVSDYQPPRPAIARGSLRHPIQLYARTQRALEDAGATALLDVFA